MTKLRLICDNDRWVSYGYKTNYDDLTVIFDKGIKGVDISYAEFVLKDEGLAPQWRNETDEWLKHSCKYGHWQKQTIITLSAEDIDFINSKCKELFGEVE